MDGSNKGQTKDLPEWARQVSRQKIKELYSLNAKGIYDDDLVDDVAYAMYTRAESIIKVTNAHSEVSLDCPACSCAIPYNKETETYTCKCGWNINRDELHKTYKRKQLVGGAAMPVIEDAVKAFPAKGAYEDKMLWIDSLIHAFHGELNAQKEETGLAFRPIARNFIEGSLLQVVELIYFLAYGDSPDLIKNRNEWIKKLKISYVPSHIKDEFS